MGFLLCLSQEKFRSITVLHETVHFVAFFLYLAFACMDGLHIKLGTIQLI